jgi:hypothetical protein
VICLHRLVVKAFALLLGLGITSGTTYGADVIFNANILELHGNTGVSVAEAFLTEAPLGSEWLRGIDHPAGGQNARADIWIRWYNAGWAPSIQTTARVWFPTPDPFSPTDLSQRSVLVLVSYRDAWEVKRHDGGDVGSFLVSFSYSLTGSYTKIGENGGVHHNLLPHIDFADQAYEQGFAPQSIVYGPYVSNGIIYPGYSQLFTFAGIQSAGEAFLAVDMTLVGYSLQRFDGTPMTASEYYVVRAEDGTLITLVPEPTGAAVLGLLSIALVRNRRDGRCLSREGFVTPTR